MKSTGSIACTVFMFVGLLSLCSCVSTGKTTGAGGSTVYQSEDYIICDLQKGETPGMLARRFLGDADRSWVILEANEGARFEPGRMIVIPRKDRNKGGLAADGYQLVPILSYHRFADDCSSPLCQPVRVFDQQMKYLRDNGYRSLTIKELLEFHQYRRSLPRKSVMITIDDGYKSVYDKAYPVLKKYGFTAVLFIYTDFVGASRNALSWDDLRKLKAEGFEIGGHSASHCDLTKRREGESAAAYAARIDKELRVSKEIIDKKLSQDTISLAFPYGRYNKTVLDLTDRTGYKIAMSVKTGSNPFFANPLALKRSQILKRDMKTFLSRMKNFQTLSLE